MAEKKKKNPKKTKIFTRSMKKKLVVVFFMVLIVLVGLGGRMFYIQTVKGQEYEKKVLSQKGYESQTIPFQRGEITDSKGTILATSVDVYNVILDCKLINEKEDYVKPTVDALIQCFLDVTEEEVRAALTEKKDSRYFVLRKKLPYDEIQAFVELEEAVYTEGKEKGDKINPNIQGVWFEKEYVRNYPYSALASKLIGFTVSGNLGIGGLEDYYNDTLNGIDGRKYGYLNADNNLEESIKDPVNGHTLVSTIDLNIQTMVEKRIAQFNAAHANEARPGTGSENTGVMVVDPQNGEILAMADNRSFDLNHPRDLTGYYSQEEIDAMSEEEQLDKLNQIWKNFCITYTYEPGSTAKPFTVAAGLDTGKLRGDEIFVCDGVENIGGHDIHCVKRAGHGPETIAQSIMNSCNDALMQMVGKIGAEEFYKYQNIFNFGLKTNIDLPGEERTDRVVYTAETTNSSSLATNAFGQNFNVTMVQLASAFSSVINGGYYYQPHLMKKIVDDNGNTVESMESGLLKQTVSKQTSDMVKEYLYKTVSEGTASGAKVPGYSMGGKTGTAQKLPRADKKYLISFIGFAPVEHPQVLVYVVIDEPNVEDQAHSSLATALAKDIFSDILPYMNIFQDEAVEGEQEPSGTPPAQTPDNQGTPEPGQEGMPGEQGAPEPGQEGTPEPGQEGQSPEQPVSPEEDPAAQENYTDPIFGEGW